MPRQWMTLALASGGLHSHLLDDRARLGRSEELHQRLGCARRRSGRVQTCGEHRYVLDGGWQRPELVDALYMQEFADLLEAEITSPRAVNSPI
jgi:hypothetical protein